MNSLRRQYPPQHQPPIEHKCHEVADGFKHLQAHVSTNAFARQQEGEAPKCHPNTRVAVLDTILAWVLLAVDRISWIMWIYGPAGAGKSAIARSAVELCLKQDIVIVRFFFYRTDGTRNTLDNVAATLAYQLIQLLPGLYPILIAKITTNPLIFNYSFEDQLRILIFEPLQELHRNSPITKAIVLLLDGVDECRGQSDQALLIRALHQFVSTKSVPVISLFLGRPEPQIKAQFQSRRISGDVRNLALDDNYKPDEDIRTYLDDIFANIKESHPFAHLLPSDWPSEEALKTIVYKSSGQFIFASVAVGYISDPRSNPAIRLEIILGIREPPGNHEPFAQLDALYRHLLSQVADLPLVLSIFATSFLAESIILNDYAELHGISDEDIEIALAELSSVVQVKPFNSSVDKFLHFSHASLSDFLLDPSRSGSYYIDRTEWSTRLSLLYLTRKPCPRDWFICDLIKEAVVDNVLRDAILNAHHEMFPPYRSRDTNCERYLGILKRIDFGDGCGGDVYKQKVFEFARCNISSKIPETGEQFNSILAYHNFLLSKHLARQFWQEKFSQIKQTHPFRYLLPDNWPEEDTLEQLISRTSGQLSYVCIAAGDITMQRRHPTLQLQPYLSGALLNRDALYKHILSQVSHLKFTKLILASLLMCQRDKCPPGATWFSYISDFAYRYNTSRERIMRTLGELSGLVSFDSNEDILLDPTRSLHYYIDLHLWATRIIIPSSYKWNIKDLIPIRFATPPEAGKTHYG